MIRGCLAHKAAFFFEKPIMAVGRGFIRFSPRFSKRPLIGNTVLRVTTTGDAMKLNASDPDDRLLKIVYMTQVLIFIFGAWSLSH
jgi:hypothetical protein